VTDAAVARALRSRRRTDLLPWIVAAAAFLILFANPVAGTFRLWLTDPDAGHGLLLAPLAFFLAWRRGLAPRRRAQPGWGAALLLGSVLLRYVAGLAAELFTMRMSAVGALFGLVVYAWGVRQLLRWWLPATLLVLALPLPEVLIGSLALPLQFRASRMGAALLEWRGVPVELAGNVIRLPGHTLFVTEACSGLRSLSALLALGFLIGGLWLRTIWARAALVVAAVPIAMLLNSVRIFLTGFAVFFIDPEMGRGVMHYTEGWFMFVAAFAALGLAAFTLTWAERVTRRRAGTTAP
jgi:exosortase